MLHMADRLQRRLYCLSPCCPWQYTMRTLQGGIIGSALIALGLALFNIFLWMLK